METARLDGAPDIEVTLRRSPRARRYSLRVSSIDGRVTLTLPVRGSRAEALAFAASRAAWIRGARDRRPAPSRVGLGDLVPVEGRLLRIEAAEVRAARVQGDLLLVPPDAARAGPRAGALLREIARSRLAAATALHAGRLGRSPGRLTLRDTRSRWGSCTPAGDLMFSWRLAMAPPEVLDYVAAHEVAHLVEMNHAPAFWAVVARLCPAYAGHRTWLRTHGTALHRYRFAD